MRTFARITSLTLMVFVAALSAASVSIAPGDIVVAGQVAVPAGESRLLVYDVYGSLKGVLNAIPNQTYTRLASDSAGSLYAAIGNPYVIHRFDGTGTMTSFAAYGDGGIVVSRSGLVYAFAYVGGGLTVLTASGSVVRSAVGLAPFAHGVDFAPDQCTIYAAGNRGSVSAVDACDGVTLPDVPVSSPTSIVTDIRVLQDGTLLLAGVPVAQTSASGATLRVHGFSADHMALSFDGRSVYTAVGALIERHDLSTDALLGTIATPLLAVNAIIVIGEPRSAAAPSALLPTLSVGLEILLIGTLAWAALIRMAQ